LFAQNKLELHPQSISKMIATVDTAIQAEDFVRAFQLISELKIYLHKNPSDSLSAVLFWKEGHGYKDLQYFEKTEDSYKKSIFLFNKIGAKSNLAKVYYDLGLMESYRNRIEPQFPYFQKSLELYTELKNQEYIFRSLDSYGYAFSGLNQPDSAIFYAKKALSMSIERVSLVTICNAKSNLGSYFIQKNQLDSAEFWLNDALKMLKSSNIFWDPYIPFDIRKNLGEIYLKTNRRSEGLVFLNDVLIYAKSTNDPILLSPTYELLLADAKKHLETDKIIQIQQDLIDFLKTQMEAADGQNHARNQLLLEINLHEKDLETLQTSLNHQISSKKLYAAMLSAFAAFLLALGYLLLQKHRFSKNLETEVAKKTASLRQSNLELERFAFAASHDLRTPLRNVISFIGLIERRISDKLTVETKEYMQFVRNYALQMNQMIDDILTYSQLEKSADLKFQPVDLNQIWQENRAAIALPNAKVEQLNALPIIQAESENLYKLVQILIENGLKFNDSPHPTVQIAAENHPSEHRIIVRDNGIGIESAYHQKVFEMFTRLHTIDKYPGSGLGLAVCKKIIELHGGRIWIDSELGKGTSVHLAFPKKAA
jgi:signal transduction histidine kinase